MIGEPHPDEQVYLLKLISGESVIVMGYIKEDEYNGATIAAVVATRTPQSLKQIPTARGQVQMLPFSYIAGSYEIESLVFFISMLLHPPFTSDQIQPVILQRYLQSISGIKSAGG